MDRARIEEASLQRLKVFVSVVENQGYTAAADALGMAQPSVSYHVKALEGALGTRLVDYRDRSIHLTREGEEVLRTARTILNEGDRLREVISKMRDGQAGRLSAGASIAFEQQFFFDRIVAPFAERHPDVHLSIAFSHSIDLAEKVSAGSLDLAYVNDWQIPDDLTFEHLHSSDLVFLVARNHDLADLSNVTPADIEQAGLIAAPIERQEIVSYHQMLRVAGVRNPMVKIEIDGVQARKLAALAGLGVLPTFVPEYAGEDPMAPLRTLRLKGDTPTLDFGLVNRTGQPWTPLMSDLADWLRQTTAPSG